MTMAAAWLFASAVSLWSMTGGGLVMPTYKPDVRTCATEVSQGKYACSLVLVHVAVCLSCLSCLSVSSCCAMRPTRR
ncbi:hypothetical protein BKA80DRAFT_260927 [Phyllosticta citrichinensis]